MHVTIAYIWARWVGLQNVYNVPPKLLLHVLQPECEVSNHDIQYTVGIDIYTGDWVGLKN
jgi:hypothetical protein